MRVLYYCLNINDKEEDGSWSSGTGAVVWPLEKSQIIFSDICRECNSPSPCRSFFRFGGNNLYYSTQIGTRKCSLVGSIIYIVYIDCGEKTKVFKARVTYLSKKKDIKLGIKLLESSLLESSIAPLFEYGIPIIPRFLSKKEECSFHAIMALEGIEWK